MQIQPRFDALLLSLLIPATAWLSVIACRFFKKKNPNANLTVENKTISKEPKKQTKKKEKEKSKQKVSTNTSNNTDSSNKNNELRVSIKGEELSDNEAELPGYTKSPLVKPTEPEPSDNPLALEDLLGHDQDQFKTSKHAAPNMETPTPSKETPQKTKDSPDPFKTTDDN